MKDFWSLFMKVHLFMKGRHLSLTWGVKVFICTHYQHDSHFLPPWAQSVQVTNLQKAPRWSKPDSSHQCHAQTHSSNFNRGPFLGFVLSDYTVFLTTITDLYFVVGECFDLCNKVKNAAWFIRCFAKPFLHKCNWILYKYNDDI